MHEDIKMETMFWNQQIWNVEQLDSQFAFITLMLAVIYLDALLFACCDVIHQLSKMNYAISNALELIGACFACVCVFC